MASANLNVDEDKKHEELNLSVVEDKQHKDVNLNVVPDTEEVKEYVIHKVVNKRTVSGQTEYLVESWRKTWRPAENLRYCRQIKEYEAIVAEDADKKMDVKGRGFGRNLEAEKILGVTDVKGEVMFLMKWKGCSETDLVPARIVNLKCKNAVTEYYEEKLRCYSKGDSGAV